MLALNSKGLRHEFRRRIGDELVRMLALNSKGLRRELILTTPQVLGPDACPEFEGIETFLLCAIWSHN